MNPKHRTVISISRRIRGEKQIHLVEKLAEKVEGVIVAIQRSNARCSRLLE
jgi:hypothetical protein